jgi:trk system potassium uptake protein
MKFCVIGLGRFGYEVATTLASNRMEVLGIDLNPSIVTSIKDAITQSICIKITDETSLRSIGVDEMETVIVAMGENFAESTLITALLKKRLHIPLVITRAVNEIHKEILLLIGADRVILPEQEIGSKLANNLSLPFSIIARITPQYSVTSINVPGHFIGKEVKDLVMFPDSSISCLGVKKDETITGLKPAYVFQEHDTLIIAGTNKDLEKVART